MEKTLEEELGLSKNQLSWKLNKASDDELENLVQYSKKAIKSHKFNDKLTSVVIEISSILPLVTPPLSFVEYINQNLKNMHYQQLLENANYVAIQSFGFTLGIVSLLVAYSLSVKNSYKSDIATVQENLDKVQSILDYRKSE